MAAARRSSCRREENAKFRKIGAEVAAAKVKELDGKGLPARAVYSQMKALAEKHAEDLEEFLELSTVADALLGQT